MANQEFVQMQADVASIIKTYGTVFSLVRPTLQQNGTYVDVTLSQTVYGVYAEQMRGFFNTTAGGTTFVDEKVIFTVPTYSGGQPVLIQNDDRLIYSNASGLNWRVLSVEFYRPDGLTLLAFQLKVS